MKKRFTKLRFYCLLVLLSCLGFQAQAGHTLWSELTYNCVAPGIYAVNLKMYRDCGGPMAPGSYVLNLKSPGCNTGRSVNMNKNSTVKVGAPYCASVGNTCNFTQFNFEEHIYTATVTFTTAERACPDWVLSWEDCCRPATVNVNNAGDLYAEAHLKLLPNLINNSPQRVGVIAGQNLEIVRLLAHVGDSWCPGNGTSYRISGSCGKAGAR